MFRSFFVYQELLENIITAFMDRAKARRDGEDVSIDRFVKAVLGKGRIRPLDESEIDERLTKLDDVQRYLAEAIDAITDLKERADENRSLHRKLLAEVSVLRESQQQAKSEAEALKEANKTNIDIFRKLAGVPTYEEVKRGRIFGFVSGIFASVIASGMFWGVTKIVKIFMAR